LTPSLKVRKGFILNKNRKAIIEAERYFKKKIGKD
jgi:hypothetical protein